MFFFKHLRQYNIKFETDRIILMLTAAVQIMRTEPRGIEQKLIFDEEALKEIMEQPRVRHKPIMIVTVSGAFRKGKSFMLCFFLRYLKGNGVNTIDFTVFRK